MKELERLSLERVLKLIQEIGSEIIALPSDRVLDRKKDTYPIHGKTMESERLLKAILDNK